MKYARSTIQRAAEILKDRRETAEREAFTRSSRLFADCPEAAQTDRELRETSREFARIMALRDRAQIEQGLDDLKRRNLACQERLRAILAERGLPPDHLEPHYTCPLCRDTGSRGANICSCFEKLLKQTAYRELCEASPLAICSFDDFDLSYYDESRREFMRGIYEYCRCYAADFSSESPNICMYGGTGLGKTHLSLAIAGEVIERGFGVVYGSAPNLLSVLEREKFGRTTENSEEPLLSCDLLILDDLGAEFSTQFTVSALYNIINTRLLRRLPTILSTNLTIEGIEQRYSERIASRLIGEYTLLKFTGKDIRQLKNNEE